MSAHPFPRSTGILQASAAQSAARIAAIFDLDGTLLPEPSLERRFFRELRYNRKIPLTNYLRWSMQTLRLLPQGLVAVQHANKRYLANVSTTLLYRHFDSIAFFEEGVARVAWHAQQKHEIVLLSGTLEPLARLAASALECELEARGLRIQPWVCATQLAEKRGRWTGHLQGEAITGPAKARAMQTLAQQARLNLRESHAYANSALDRHVLCAVGHAHAVNPGKALAALANEQNWPIWHWHIEKPIPRTNANHAMFSAPTTTDTSIRTDSANTHTSFRTESAK
jgi:phosphoserine phosphatase